jgi:hypothetical protein
MTGDIQQIPVTSDARQTMVCTLGGVAYELDLKFNEMSLVWTLDLYTNADGVLIGAGIPLVLGANVLQHLGPSYGAIFLIDTSGTSADAGPDDLGSRVLVYWMDLGATP